MFFFRSMSLDDKISPEASVRFVKSKKEATLLSPFLPVVLQEFLFVQEITRDVEMVYSLTNRCVELPWLLVRRIQ